MNFIIKDEVSTIDSLQKGDIFSFCNRVYMKTDEFCCVNGCRYNSIILENGTLSHVGDLQKIIPLKIKEDITVVRDYSRETEEC